MGGSGCNGYGMRFQNAPGVGLMFLGCLHDFGIPAMVHQRQAHHTWLEVCRTLVLRAHHL